MEMMFKLTQGKPPFIGVVFDSIEQAEINKDLLDLKLCKFSIMVTGSNGDNISFRLHSEEPSLLRNYDNIKCDSVLFRKWRVYTHLKINFGHVIINKGKPEIVWIGKKMFVLPIEYFICG